MFASEATRQSLAYLELVWQTLLPRHAVLYLTSAPCPGFDGIGLEIKKQSNLILRNIVSSSVLADNGDGLTIQVRQTL